MTTTQAVILAGGKGTRLFPLTRTVPKPMVQVSGKPFLAHIVALLQSAGIRDLVLLTGTLAEQIEEYFGDGGAFGVTIRYSRESSPLGTGGAVRMASSLLADSFFLLNGDTFLPTDWVGMDAELQRTGAIGLLSTFRDTARLDVPPIVAVDQEHLIVAYDKEETPQGGNAVDAGVSLFRSEILEFLPSTDPFSLEAELYPRLIETRQLRAWWTENRFYDIGTPDRLDTFRSVLS
jgi:mannose-1-phosphate guanylyltransferase